MTSPKTLALRFRIWQFAAPKGWDVSVHDIADALGLSWMTARNAVHGAGWSNRIRKVSSEQSHRMASSLYRGGAEKEDPRLLQDVLAGRVNSEFTA